MKSNAQTSTLNGNGMEAKEYPNFPEGNGTPNLAIGSWDVDAEIAALELRVRKLRHLHRLQRLAQDLESRSCNGKVCNGKVESALEPILELVCARFSVKKEDVMSRDRRTRIVWPRHIVTYLLRQLTEGSSNYIGQVIGGRDHATVLNSLRSVEDRMETEHDFDALIKALKKEAQAIVEMTL